MRILGQEVQEVQAEQGVHGRSRRAMRLMSERLALRASFLASLFAIALLALVLVALAPMMARTGELSAQPVANARVDVDDEANDQRWRVARCLLGVSYGSPLKLSVAAAGGLRRAFTDRSVCTYGAVHVGLGGTRASLGTAVTLGSFGSAIGVSGGAIRTFGNPGGKALGSRTYVGGSVHVWPVLALHTDIGVYQLVTRSGEASQRLITWSFGFGY